MIPLAHALEAEGWMVSNPPLAGHMTSPHELAKTTWPQWVQSARGAYEDLSSRCERVAILGLSMGGAVALYLGVTESPSAVVAISTLIRVRPLVVRASRAASRVLPLAPLVFRLGPKDPRMRQYQSPYRAYPLAGPAEVSALLEETRRLLPSLRVPLLVVQGRRDRVAPRESAQEIADLVTAAPVEVLWLPRSGHVITLDEDREVFFSEVRRFLRGHLDVPERGQDA
jgi:carboxylesterase